MWGRPTVILWKPIEMFLSKKTVNKKQYYIPGAVVVIRATIKDLKDTGVVITKQHACSICLFGLSRKQM